MPCGFTALPFGIKSYFCLGHSCFKFCQWCKSLSPTFHGCRRAWLPLQPRKEQRKSAYAVIGAFVCSITAMLSKDFLKLICLSLLIACPLARWLLSQWLQSFAYHITISLAVFVIAAVSVILITLLTIGYQFVTAAFSNPVKNLRTD